MNNLNLTTLLAITAVALAGPQQTLAKSKTPPEAEIKLNWAEGLMTLPVNINGKDGSLMVDTGASMTCLRNTSAKELNIQLQTDNEAQGLGISGDLGQFMSGDAIITVPGLKPDSFPNLSKKHSFVPLSSLNGITGAFGIIGMDTLSAAGARIDTVHGTMRLNPHDDIKTPEGFLKIPMSQRKIKAKKQNEFIWTIPISINGKNGMMIVDTGADSTVLDADFAKSAGISMEKLGTSAAGGGHQLQELSTGTATEVILGGKVNLGSIEVSGSDLRAIALNTISTDRNSTPLAGILGMDQLHRVQAILDCKQGAFYSSNKAITPNIDPVIIGQVLSALIERGDQQASKLQDAAVKNNGNLAMNSLQASQLIIRAHSLGLIKNIDGNTPSGLDHLVTAIQKLATAGDEEAKKYIAEAQANNGELKLPPEKASELIARARAKNLLPPTPPQR